MLDELMIERGAVRGVTHLDQYFGLWAIDEEIFRGLVERVDAMDVGEHVRLSVVRGPLSVVNIKEKGGPGEGEETGGAKGQNPGEMAQRGYEVTGEGVAVVPVMGVLTKYGSSLDDGGGYLGIRRAVRLASRDPQVKGIVLGIDSPGGSVKGMDDLAAEIGRARSGSGKPVMAYIEDQGTSAAYWLAASAGMVFANPAAAVGGMGTFGVVRDSSALAANLGIRVHVIRAGKYKGMTTPGTAVTDEHLAEIQRSVDGYNALMLDGVARGRGMSADRVKELADGRAHLAGEALGLGLIDGVMGWDGLMEQMRKAIAGKGSVIRGPSSVENSREMAGGMKERAEGRRLTEETGENGTKIQSEVTETMAGENERKSATLAELKGAFPKAEAGWVLGQLEKGATVEEARAAWVTVLEARAAAAEARAAAAEETLAASSKPIGQPALPSGVAAGVGGVGAGTDPIASWDAAVAEKMKGGKSKRDAIRAVATEQEALREAYIEAHNLAAKAKK